MLLFLFHLFILVIFNQYMGVKNKANTKTGGPRFEVLWADAHEHLGMHSDQELAFKEHSHKLFRFKSCPNLESYLSSYVLCQFHRK